MKFIFMAHKEIYISFLPIAQADACANIQIATSRQTGEAGAELQYAQNYLPHNSKFNTQLKQQLFCLIIVTLICIFIS